MGLWDDKHKKHELKYNSWKMHDYAQEDRVLHKIIEDKAKKNPNHVVFQFKDTPITFEQLNTNSNRAANGFSALGVTHGDKVALMMNNCVEFLYAWFGLNKIGAIEVPINVALKGPGLVHQIVQSDSVALVADIIFLDRLDPVSDDLISINHVIFCNSMQNDNLPKWKDTTTVTVEQLLDHSESTPNVNVYFNDLASILFTSGTTGVSKGVQMSHYYWYDIWSSAINYSRYTEDDILYTGLPFFHGNAQGMTIGPAILADAKAVIVDRFSAGNLWDDVKRWGCTEVNYIGGIIPILMKADPAPSDSDNPVRIMVGAAAPVDIWHDFEKRFNTKLLEVYGMTECYCCLANPYVEGRPGSCGKPIASWDVKIVDDNKNECSPGEVGEFLARPKDMHVGTTGYFNMPQKSIELFENLWINTGDLGRVDEDGFFFFVDRKKQALRRRGENISSFEVEDGINSHPAILESCVVGVPSDVGEEDVKAVVICMPGMSVTERELIAWCESRLAYFSIPRYIAFRDSLPKTPSERVEKYKLKNEGVTEDCWDRDASGIVLKR